MNCSLPFRIGALAVHLGAAFAGKGEGVRRSGRAAVAEQAAGYVESGSEQSYFTIRRGEL